MSSTEAVLSATGNDDLLDRAPIGFVRMSASAGIVHANGALVTLLHAEDRDALIEHYRGWRHQLFVDKDEWGTIAEMLGADPDLVRRETRLFRADGAVASVQLDLRATGRRASGESSTMELEGFVIDVTAQTHAQRFAQLLADEVPGMVWVYDTVAQHNVWANRRLDAFLRHRGVADPQTAPADAIMAAIHPDDFVKLVAHTDEVVSGKIGGETSIRIRMQTDRGWEWHQATLVVFGASAVGAAMLVVGMLSSIHELQQQMERATKDAQQGRMSIQETNHRMKNNLLLVTSLLGLHERARGVDLSDVRRQLGAIAHVHDLLSESGHEDTVYLDRQISAIVDAIVAPVGAHATVLASPIPVDARTAVSIGLIVNELVTNAVKHGAHDGETPEIEIHLTESDNGMIRLTVANSGDPLPPDFDPTASTSLGMTILHALVEQLDGTVTIEREPRTQFVCTLGRAHASN